MNETVTGRPCPNPECHEGTVYGCCEDANRECPWCQGTTVLHCDCGRAPATVDTVDVRTGKAIVCCVGCDEAERAYWAGRAKEVA